MNTILVGHEHPIVLGLKLAQVTCKRSLSAVSLHVKFETSLAVQGLWAGWALNFHSLCSKKVRLL